VDAEVRCRCEVLNNLTGDLARDYARRHLDQVRADGLGRAIHRCPETGVSWLEERSISGYTDEVIILRRSPR
jgi:hypothetical protein